MHKILTRTTYPNADFWRRVGTRVDRAQAQMWNTRFGYGTPERLDARSNKLYRVRDHITHHLQRHEAAPTAAQPPLLTEDVA